MKKASLISVILLLTAVVPSHSSTPDLSASEITTDICVYGGTSGGVIAAYTAIREGKSVLLIEPTGRVGGMTTGGLGKTDVGRTEAIRGLAKDFYVRVGRKYGEKNNKPVYNFEPKIALAVFDDYIKEASVPILYNYRIIGCKKRGATVKSITLENSRDASKSLRKKVRAKVFIDCSYEGDLMARAGISYTVGRESNLKYSETYNGVQLAIFHQFPDHIDPYVIKGDSTSGLLYGILPGKIGRNGDGDNHVQAYNFRITLTDDPDNRIPIAKPDNYDASRYELMLRMHEGYEWKGLNDVFAWDIVRPHKTDINNRGGFSTDMIGANWDYPEASYAKRDSIVKAHRDYTLGMLYFVGHDERIPKKIRNMMLQWGLPKDEYPDNGHFTPQLYIREARRMIGRLVMTQHHCQGREVADDVIGWASYNMDSHNSGRFVINGQVKNEGDVQVKPHGSYPVGYGAITPKESEADNVIVPVCLSASHIAYGSIRMEPVFMVLGESSALAACRAIDFCGGKVQHVKAEDVMKRFYEIEKKLK